MTGDVLCSTGLINKWKMDDEEIYDDTSAIMAEDHSTGLSAIRQRFEAQKTPVMGLKPTVTPPKPTSPKPTAISPKPKYGGAPGMNVSACNGVPGKDVNNLTNTNLRAGTAISKNTEEASLRDKSNSVNIGAKRNSKVNIPDAFRNNNAPPPIDKPKPKPVVAPKVVKNDANNNASASKTTSSAVGKLDLNSRLVRKTSETSVSDTTKFGAGKISPRDPSSSKGQKPPISAEKPNSPRGIKVLDTNGPIDFKAKLKPVGSKVGTNTVSPVQKTFSSSEQENDNVELRKSKKYGENRKSVIRKLDMKKFHRTEPSSLNDSNTAPEKPEKLEFEIDIEALCQDFIQAVQTIDETSKKDHGWIELEELYDDCGNVVRPISSRTVSIIGSRRPKPRARKMVPLIPDMTEDDERAWSDAGFTGDTSDTLPPPPLELMEQETYDDVAVKESQENDDDDGELYEALPDEPYDEEYLPPVGPKPPEPPRTPLPKSHTDSTSEGVPDTPTENSKEAKEAEKEKKRKEKEEEKKRQKQEKELKKLAKSFGIQDPAILATSVGKGKVKNTAKAKKKNELAVTEGDEVDIIRMVDNPTGKWLIRILSSQKIGFCDENNVEVDTSSILNFMKGGPAKASTSEAPEEPQEVYEDVDGEDAQELIEDEIYEECS